MGQWIRRFDWRERLSKAANFFMKPTANSNSTGALRFCDALRFDPLWTRTFEGELPPLDREEAAVAGVVDIARFNLRAEKKRPFFEFSTPVLNLLQFSQRDYFVQQKFTDLFKKSLFVVLS